ncbi:MAG: hypothetical protein QM820_28340 [Minicystis sp.]
MSNRRRRILVGGGIALTALCLLLSKPRSKGAQPAAEKQTVAAASPAAPRVSPIVHGVNDPASAEDEAADVPIIDAVRIEKNEVCIGEENLVTVEAHTGRGDAGLRYRIEGHDGRRVPLRRYPAGWDDPVEVTHTVTVTAPNGRSTSAPIPAYDVLPCRKPYNLHVEGAWSNGEVKLVAHVAANGKPKAEGHGVEDRAPLDVIRYRWTFGDGTVEETDSPEITHRYGAGAKADILVSCEAVGRTGETVTGRLALAPERSAAPRPELAAARKAQLTRVRERLGRDDVSEDDFRRAEKDGALVGLPSADDVPPPPDARPVYAKAP